MSVILGTHSQSRRKVTAVSPPVEPQYNKMYFPIQIPPPFSSEKSAYFLWTNAAGDTDEGGGKHPSLSLVLPSSIGLFPLLGLIVLSTAFTVTGKRHKNKRGTGLPNRQIGETQSGDQAVKMRRKTGWTDKARNIIHQFQPRGHSRQCSKEI